MYTLFLKIATRYLLKNKLYSFINIFGLTIGIASFVLIMLYVSHERSYDKFEGSENVYRVYMDYADGSTFEPGDAQTYNLAGPTFKREFPEVLDFVRFYRIDKAAFIYNDEVYEETAGSLADGSYFDVFNASLIEGKVSEALERPGTVVLTESTAEKIFGDENPMNKTISIFWAGSEQHLTVTGIMKNIAQNTHFKLNYLISFSTLKTWNAFEGQQELNWNQNNFFTYLKIEENTNIDVLRDKVITSNFEDNIEERHNIEPLEDIHLYSDKPYEADVNGSIGRIKFLSAIALIILILSWLNYINLSTTKSLERAKEIGIRKVAGAQRGQLALQSLSESFILNGIAIGIGLALVLLALPFYNSLIGKTLDIGMFDIDKLLPIFGFIVVGIVLAGLYPAVLLSGYSPSRALKGKVRTSKNGFTVRKGLMIGQFLATIILLIGTLVVSKQISFLEKQPIGVDLNQTIALEGEILGKENDSLALRDFKVFQEELKKLPFVKITSTAQTYPGDGYEMLSSTRGITLPDGTETDKQLFYTYPVNPDYFKLLKNEFVFGQAFLPTARGSSEKVVVNEQFVKKMGIGPPEDVINKTLKFWGNEWVISGVIKDYHHFGLKTSIAPIIIRHGDAYNKLLVKLDESATSTVGFSNAISEIQQKWIQIFPQSTFDYSFLDQKFKGQYNDDKKFGEAFGLFTALAIFIASLGLFGLTSYTCIQRKKEIGIRKVNGATIGQILSLLNQDVVKWVGLAFLIAVPVSWYTMDKWLEGFAYKTTVSWWIFALAGLSALAIALLTVSWQSFRAAVANPVDALRDE